MNLYKWMLGRQRKQRGCEREEGEGTPKPLNPPIVPPESGLHKEFQGVCIKVLESARDKSACEFCCYARMIEILVTGGMQ